MYMPDKLTDFSGSLWFVDYILDVTKKEFLALHLK